MNTNEKLKGILCNKDYDFYIKSGYEWYCSINKRIIIIMTKIPKQIFSLKPIAKGLYYSSQITIKISNCTVKYNYYKWQNAIYFSIFQLRWIGIYTPICAGRIII